jgi:hypothetical protein
MENGVMGIAFGTAVTVARGKRIGNFVGTYHQIKTQDAVNKVPSVLPIAGNRFNRTKQTNFEKIPGSPLCYWISDRVLKVFSLPKKINELGFSKKGLDTGENTKFYRLWFEVNNEADYWIPLNKGGKFRKWYGNHEYVINWSQNGSAIKRNGKANIRNEKFYFKPSVSWSDVTSGKLSARLTPSGFIFDATGPSYFGANLFSMLAYMNSKVFASIAALMMPTIHFTNGQVGLIPYNTQADSNQRIVFLSKANVLISKTE